MRSWESTAHPFRKKNATKGGAPELVALSDNSHRNPLTT
jgi:hypothetical protein